MSEHDEWPICEECDEEMHPGNLPDGTPTWGCDSCGWSFDEAPDRPSAEAQQEPEGDGITSHADGTVVAVHRIGVNRFVTVDDFQAACDRLRARVQPRRVSEAELRESFALLREQVVNTIDGFADHVGIEITPEEEDDRG